MLPIHLNNSTLVNPKRVGKRIAQMLEITSQTIVLPQGHWVSLSDNLDITNALDCYHSVSIQFGDKLNRQRFDGEIRLFMDGSSSHKGCRSCGMVFLRYGRPLNFESKDLLAQNEDRFVYQSTLAASLREMVNLANKAVAIHEEELTGFWPVITKHELA